MLLQPSRLQPGKSHENRRSDGDNKNQPPLHERTPFGRRLPAFLRETDQVPRTRRGSTSNHTNKIARMLLPMGRMPQINPSHGVGMASEGIVRAGDRVVLGPHGDGSGIIAFDLTPSAENQERLIERIVHKNEFQSVVVGMLQHGAQRIHTRHAEELRVGQLRCAVTRQLGQQAGRVVLAIHAVRVGVSRDFGKSIAESKREIAILIVAIAIEESRRRNRR